MGSKVSLMHGKKPDHLHDFKFQAKQDQMS